MKKEIGDADSIDLI